MPHALIVSYYFPPSYSIGGKRAFGFAKHLSQHGWSSTVLAAHTHPDERVDPSHSDADLVDCNVRREYFSQSEVLKRHRPPQGLAAAAAPKWSKVRERRGFARIQAELRIAPIIGLDTSLIPFVAARIVRVSRQCNANLIFVTSPPWEAAFAAAIAARITKLPLVIDLRDPWSFNPFQALKPSWNRAIVSALEPRLMREASALVTTTDAVRDEYRRLVPGARIVSIRTGFDDKPVEPLRDDAITFIHFGNCYGDRSLAPFVQALATVVRKRGLTKENIRMLNLGRIAKGDIDLAAELGISDFLHYQTVLPYAEGISRVAGADLALLPSFGAEPWFIPGKFYDYLRAKVPILAASAPPEIQNILETTRVGWCFPGEDTEALARRMEDAIDARKNSTRLVDPNSDALRALTVQSTVAELAALFNSLVR
jgi:glycosyltransferase involved in cell wall biosynthesis